MLLVAGLLSAGYLRLPGDTAEPPTSGPVPTVGLPPGPVAAAWLQLDTIGGPGADQPATLVVADDRALVTVLPGQVTDSCHKAIFSTVLSPDGTKVALEGPSVCDTPRTHSVRIIDLATDVVVATLPGGDGGVAWAPDSARLILANTHRPGEAMTASGAVVAQLTAGFDPHWVPSSVIALSAYDAGADVVVFRSDGTRVTELTGIRRGGRWISEGLFAGAAASENGTEVLAVDGNGPNRDQSVVSTTWPCRPGPLSPNGKTVVGLGKATVGILLRGPLSYLQGCDVGTGRLKRLSPNYTPVYLEDPGRWLPNGLIAVLIGDTFQTVDIRTGHHHVIAYTGRTTAYYFGLTTTLQG